MARYVWVFVEEGSARCSPMYGGSAKLCQRPREALESISRRFAGARSKGKWWPFDLFPWQAATPWDSWTFQPESFRLVVQGTAVVAALLRRGK